MLNSFLKTATVQPCPVTRDFRVVDMDQSDNVDTSYLLIDGKKLAQNTPANAAANKNATCMLFSCPIRVCFTDPVISNPKWIRQSFDQRLHLTDYGLRLLHNQIHHNPKWYFWRYGAQRKYSACFQATHNLTKHRSSRANTSHQQVGQLLFHCK